MSYSDKPQIVTLAKGQSCTGHMMPIAKAVMFEDIPQIEITHASDATDALTIRYREDVSKGDVIEYGGEQWEVLSVFDPYAGKGIKRMGTVIIERSPNSQEGKWLKCLVRRV